MRKTGRSVAVMYDKAKTTVVLLAFSLLLSVVSVVEASGDDS